jgi:hypothetical protein
MRHGGDFISNFQPGGSTGKTVLGEETWKNRFEAEK